MLLRIAADADAEVAAVLTLEAADGRHQLVGVGKARRIRRETLLAGQGIAPESHHVFDAQELEILQQSFGLIGRSTATDQVRHHFHLPLRLDGGADRHGAHPVANHAADIGTVGLRVETELVAVRRDVDVARCEFHQGRDAVEQLFLADTAHRRHDFE